MTNINYADDILKHYVRKYGWLPACHDQRSAVRPSKTKPLRYFTFCAAEAIDVFMLEWAGILKRNDSTGRLESVYFCERDEEAFGKIASLIGSPAQGFQGEFEKIVLFEEDDETRDRELYMEVEDPLPTHVRKKLRHKDAHHRLKQSFPFDVINLDVFGNMFPPRRDHVIGPLLESIIRVLRWQTESLSARDATRRNGQFVLLLTSSVDADNTNEMAVEQLKDLVSNNIHMYPEFRTSFADQFGHDQVGKLAEERFGDFFCLSLAKFIAQKTLFDLGWETEFGPMHLYSRQDTFDVERQYQIMHSVTICKRIQNLNARLDDPRNQMYKSTAVQLINDGAETIDGRTKEASIVEELKKELAEIIEYRDQVRG